MVIVSGKVVHRGLALKSNVQDCKKSLTNRLSMNASLMYSALVTSVRAIVNDIDPPSNDVMVSDTSKEYATVSK